MHGMREFSGFVNLTAGHHDFRIEFFQGGGPHGLQFSWEGPNVSKATIPASAFYVDGDYTPQIENLIHEWNFEEEEAEVKHLIPLLTTQTSHY